MSLLEKQRNSLIPVFILATSLIQFLLLMLALVTFGRLEGISRAKVPKMVELIDGTTTRIKPLPPNQRSPQTLSTFGAKTMIALMSWNNLAETNPGTKPRLDAGVATGKGKVTTEAWAASFALSQDFRSAFLAEIAHLTPKQVFSNQMQSYLSIRHLSQPQEIETGKWRLDMVADLLIFSGKEVSKAIAFNKSILIRSVEPPSLPPKATEVQKSIYQARKDGLEIYQILNLGQ